jgi:hypothetical protein
MDFLEEMSEYIDRHREAYGEHARFLAVHVNYEDLLDWVRRGAGILYAYTGDPDIHKMLPEGVVLGED